MNAVETALQAKLAGDATLVGLGVQGVFHRRAPQGQAEPVVVFNQQSAVDYYTHAGRAYRDLVYLVKAIDQSESAARAGQIADRLDALLTDQPLTVAGWTVIARPRRFIDVDYDEPAEGIIYQHLGGLFRVKVQAA